MYKEMKNKEMELLEIQSACIENINQLLNTNGWSIKQLADRAKLPYDSVKKLLYGKIGNPSIYTLAKISQAFNCSVDFLLKSDSIYGFNVSQLPSRALTLLQEIVNFERYLQQLNVSENTDLVPVFVPSGSYHDGSIFDSVYYESVDISAYREEFGDIIMCGVKVIGSYLHPTYLNNDILLVARDRFPLNNEVAVFIKEHKIYIRKYILGNPIIMESINGTAKPIKIYNIDDIHFFGRVLTVVRQ